MSNNKKNIFGKFAGKGYYIALILCAVAIGISGYLYYRNTNSQTVSVDDPQATVDVMNPGSQTQPSNTTPTTPTTVKQPLKTQRPVDGETVMDYSMDCLCYNPTTRDWRTHNGMDFAATAGTVVWAAADGTVYTIYEDDTMGTTIVIRHDDGYVTTYSSMDDEVLVAVGDQVAMGQAIGYVGCSALLETALGDHLHFSVTCNGVSMDPEDFFALN